LGLILNKTVAKYLKFLLLCFIWSTTWAAIKIGLHETPVLLGLGLRFSVAALILFGALYFKRRQIDWAPVAIRQYLMVGLITMAFSYFCTYWGTQFVSSGLSSILWATLPLCVGLYARFLIPNDRLGLLRILAIGVTLVGVINILSDQQLIFSTSILIGSLVILAGVAISAYPNVYLKMAVRPYDPLTLTAVAMGIAALVHLVGATMLGEWNQMIWSAKNIGAIVYLGVFGSAIAFYVYYDLLGQISVVKLSFVTFITPGFATLLGWLFLGEMITVRELVGMALIICGLALYDWRKYRDLLIPSRNARRSADA